MRSRRVLVVDLRATRVVGGVFASDGAGNLVLEDFACEHVGLDANRSRVVATEEAWKRVMARCGRSARGADIRVALPPGGTFYRFVRTPALGADARRCALAFEAAEVIPLPLDEVVWDAAMQADDGAEVAALVIAAKRAEIEVICASAGRVGCGEIQQFVPPAVALQHLSRRTCGAGSEAVALLEIDEACAHIVLQQSQLYSARTFAVEACWSPTGSDAIEAVPASDDRVAELAGEVTRSLRHLQRQSGITAPVRLLACGSALPEGLAERLREQLGIHVERVDPLATVQISVGARRAGTELMAVGLGVMVGVADGWIRSAGVEPNLLPPEISSVRARRSRERWSLAAAALVMLALLPPLARYQRFAELNRTAITESEATLRPLRAAHARHAENVRRLETLTKEISKLEPAFRARTAWIDFLNDLQTRLAEVEDVWLDRLQIVQASAAHTPPSGNLNGGHITFQRIAVSGRMLNLDGEAGAYSEQAAKRLKHLLTSLRDSPFVTAVEHEHFDESEQRLLRFDVILRMSPGHLL